MLYADRFSGHLDHEDPRTPATAAGGCIWPTIPAYRYLLKSTNATGILAVLNTNGILIEKVTPGDAHDDCQYNMIAGPPPVLFCILWKRFIKATAGYKWEVSMNVSLCGIMEKTIVFPEQKCNKDFTIGSMSCPLYTGDTGTGFKAYQVEWNQTQPPA